MHTLEVATTNLYIKFEAPSFIRFRDMMGEAQNLTSGQSNLK